MPSFRYKAVSPSGETLQGQMEAISSEEVVARLQEQGNMPIMAEKADSGFAQGLTDLLSGGNKVGRREVGLFTEQLSTLIGAGLPLDRALHVLEDLSDSEQLQSLVKMIRDGVREGSSLSDAMEAQHGVFPRLYINMVRAGEVGGTLDVTLARLSDYLDRSKELKDSIVSALIYPILLLVMAIGSLMILLVYVVPQFMPIFEELGGDMPLLTQVVLGVGGVLQHYWWLIMLTTLVLIITARQQMSKPETRFRWDQRFLGWKMIGDLVAKVETARLARTVGTLLVNGVPLLAALSIGRNVMTNTAMAAGLEQAAKEVKTGGALAQTLAATKLFPKLALQMINVGQETGQLDAMLLKVADTYDTEVRTAIDRMMALFVPVLTLGLAVMVAMIVMSILMAILSINDLIG
jgi:general secretion pathway protein F